MIEVSRTEIQTKRIVEFQKEEIMASDTPRDIKENTIVQEISLQNEAPFTNNVEKSWRSKTRSKNKLRVNMKAILNPKFQKNIVIVIEDSYSQENLQATEEAYQEEEQTLAKIQKELMHTPDMF